MTSISIAERTSKRLRPIACLVAAIRFRILLPEMNISLLLFVTGSRLQAASMHKFLHFSVNFMLNFSVLQYSLVSCNPLLDKSVFLVTSVVALRRPIAGPVAAIRFRILLPEMISVSFCL